MNKTASSLAVKCRLVGATLAVCLVILDISLRLLGQGSRSEWSGFYAQDETVYCLKTNVAMRCFFGEYHVNVYTCDMGFRSKRPGPRYLGGRPYYMAVGASEAFGWALNYEDTTIGVFAENLERRGIDVLNTGSPGHNLAMESATFNRVATATKRPPAVVLICLNPFVISTFDRKPDLLIHFGFMYDKHANWRLLYANRILNNISPAWRFLKKEFQSLKLLKREFHINSSYLIMYAKSDPIRVEPRKGAFLKALTELENHIRAVGGTPVCVYTPHVGGFILDKLKAEGMLDNQMSDTQFFPELLKAHCHAAGVQFVNFEPILQQRLDTGAKLNLDFDAHFDAPTSRILGEYLYRELCGGKLAGN
jgi:hypothetical protein